MEKFLSIPLEKQHGFVDAALVCFGTNGYKKTSISDIAAKAGISKAMVFHYFGTKKALYLYLINYCSDLVMNEIEAKFDRMVTDFFDRLKQATEIKVAVIEKHPAVLAFLMNVYFETNEEVRQDIASILAAGEEIRRKIAFTGVDESKFKDGIDMNLLLSMLTWMAEGSASQMSKNDKLDIRAIANDFSRCIDMLKSHFYKPEYLGSDGR
ncbi:TetR/AcrR family transcriptional regulator [Paenibacillus antri]|uniref:TetR/AcrR family transcriptional regulator n=1 Tax=Paenibacillus antri TaxID=2582848 RepID=A0A5R9FXZ7_9BACL|nr:TetR/AcrR family transcriptional regulator [Paenibacillus antri]TLS48917.1 TetR/AcrR family transcriptional regulator [Paenibacillus antri]